MADPKTKDGDQNAIPPETDWPKPNIWPPRQWPVCLKQLISNFSIVIGVLIGFIVIIGCIFLLYDIIRTYFDTNNEKQFANLRNSLFILAALIGAPFLVWRTMLAAEQTKTAEKQANTAQEKAYTELFTQAVEQLGSVKPETTSIKDKNGELILDEAGRPLTEEKYVPNIEVRVGALYALERIMHDSDKDASAIIDTLTTYVKHNCGKPKDFDYKMREERGFEKISNWLHEVREYTATSRHTAQEFQKDAPANREDILTALKIIGRRPVKYKTDGNMLDLSSVNFQGAILKDLDLSYCNFIGANMQGASLSNCKMNNSQLLIVHMQGAWASCLEMYKVDMRWAHMQGASFNNVQMLESQLLGVKMQGVIMQDANLQGTNLAGANMQTADMTGANLQNADISIATMEGTEVSWANFHDTIVLGTNMAFVNIDEVLITNAHTKGTSVLGVDFSKAKFDFDVLQKQVMDMFGHKTQTFLPDGMKVPDHWSEADMDTAEGYEQYEREWEAFMKEKGVE